VIDGASYFDRTVRRFAEKFPTLGVSFIYIMLIYITIGKFITILYENCSTELSPHVYLAIF
jgi:hypothetical protein